MRRIWLLLLALLLLSGCAQLKEVIPQAEEPVNDPLRLYPTPTPWPTTLSTAERIRERGTMIVGIRYDLEPLSFIDADGRPAGLEVDLAHELARRWLGDANAVEFRQVRSDTALQHLQQGDVDFVLAGIVHTQEAEGDADFGPTYFLDGQAILTFPELNITTADELEGKRVGVVDGSGALEALQAATTVSMTVEHFDGYFEAVEALQTRQIDAYADLRHRLERARREVPGTIIVGQSTFLPVTPLFAENDPFFANLLTLTFQDMARDGTRDQLYARWLPNTAPPAAPPWPGEIAAPALDETPRERSHGGLLEGARQRGVLEVGYLPQHWPYSADRGDSVQTGFEVHLIEKVAERWFGSRQAVTFVPVTEEDALTRLQQGEIDLLLGGWVHTREGELQYDYSLTTFDDGVSLLSRATDPVPTLEALEGRPVGVIAGSAGEMALPTLSRQLGTALNAATYPDLNTAVEALQRGDVVALLAERWLLLDPFYHVGGFSLSDARFTRRPIAFVVPQGNSDFLDLLNLTLAALRADGTYDTVYRLWFDDPIPPADPWPGAPIIPLSLR